MEESVKVTDNNINAYNTHYQIVGSFNSGPALYTIGDVLVREIIILTSLISSVPAAAELPFTALNIRLHI